MNHPDFSESVEMPSVIQEIGDGSDQLFYGCNHNSGAAFYAQAKRITFFWSDGADEPVFAWLVELNDGRFACVEGGHDYTGWDCQSSLEVCAVEPSEIEASTFLTDDPRRAYQEARA